VTEAPRAGGLYGTILVLSVIIALSKSGKAEADIMLGGVVITSVVFFVVHVYADVLAERVKEPDRSWTSLTREIGHQEVAILEAAVLPAIPLLLGTLGTLDREAASWGAIGCGLVSLFGWGLLLGRALGYGTLRSVTFGAANIALGGVMVVLKVLVH
jgi:hypothetical protein